MSEQNPSDYYVRRAAAERQLAAKATDPSVARLHREMAQRYDEIVAADSVPELQIANDASNSNPMSFSSANEESG